MPLYSELARKIYGLEHDFLPRREVRKKGEGGVGCMGAGWTLLLGVVGVLSPSPL